MPTAAFQPVHDDTCAISSDESGDEERQHAGTTSVNTKEEATNDSVHGGESNDCEADADEGTTGPDIIDKTSMDAAADVGLAAEGSVAKRHRPLVQDGPVPSVAAPSSSSTTRTKASASGFKRVYSSPNDILIPISPYPACTIRVNFNDHRFTATWKKHISCDFWIDELANQSFSCGFTPTTWRQALCRVHDQCWVKCQLALDAGIPEVKLQGPCQIPGEIPESVFASLESVMNTMPERKDYYSLRSSKANN